MAPMVSIETLAARLGPNFWRRLPDMYGERLLPWWKAHHWIRHVSKICVNEIERGNGRVIVNVPWAYGKTKFVGQILPAWFLDRYRTRKVITASSGVDLSTESGRSTREILRDAGVPLKDDQTAKGQWLTEEGGGMKATSIGKRIMGFHFHLGLVDDLYGSWDDAQSPLYRMNVIDWFRNTFMNRAMPNATVIILNTRFHPDDLTGWLVSNSPEPWQLVRLPCYAEADDPVGREPGDLLCPEMWTREQMERKRLAGTEEGWQAMAQQAPVSQSSTRAFRNFSEANVDPALELTDALPLDMAWDFNTNPGCTVLLGQYDQEADVFRVVHEVEGMRRDVVAAMDEVEKIVRGYGGMRWERVRIFGDSTGGTRAAGYGTTHYQTIESKGRSFGWKIVRHVREKAPRILDSLNCVNAVLFGIDKRRRFFVHPRCRRLLADFRNQPLDVDGLPDKSDTTMGHAGDCSRYWVSYLRPMVDPTLLRALPVGGFVT